MKRPSNFQIEDVKSEEQNLSKIEAKKIAEVVSAARPNIARGGQNIYPLPESGLRGVMFMKGCRRRRPWRARITIHNKDNHLGCFATKEDAARAYDKAALAIYGPTAIVNFPDEVEQ